MKRRVLIGLLICSVLLFITFPLSKKSYADPFTAGQIASTAYALFEGWGISFTATGASASGMNDFMSDSVEAFVNSQGGSLADVFVGTIAVDAAGKLVVGYQMYNSFISFLDWMKEAYNLDTVDSILSQGSYGNYIIEHGYQATDDISATGISIVRSGFREFPTGEYLSSGYTTLTLYENGIERGHITQSRNRYFTGDYFLGYVSDSRVSLTGTAIEPYNGSVATISGNINLSQIRVDNKLSWNGESFIEPSVLNPDKEWTGTIGGYSEPDTNLDQLLDSINEAIADNNLVVDGEVIDIPIPPPTPEPIDPDTPLSNVPWEGLDNNLQQLYEQGLEEIGAIGDAQDAITDAVADQTGALEDALADNAGVVSGAIGQAVSDIQDSISEQTETLSESASATAEAAESIAEALEDETINWQKFDLRGLFPFCIPFDIYNMLEALDASPTAPHVQLPFVIDSINFSYTIDLDFSAFDQVAAVMRQMELIAYAIALAWATSKVIKW